MGTKIPVYLYALEVVGMEIHDSNLIHALCGVRRRNLLDALGPHICTGNNIFLLQEIGDKDEDIKFPVTYRGTDYVLVVRPDT